MQLKCTPFRAWRYCWGIILFFGRCASRAHPPHGLLVWMGQNGHWAPRKRPSFRKLGLPSL